MIRIIEYGALTATRGGIESYIRNQILSIKKENKEAINFDFLVPNEEEKLAYEDELKGYGCKVYRAYRRWKDSFWGHYVDLYKFFKENKNNYDIAVANYLDLQNINFLIVAKLFGLKTVAHAHSSSADRSMKYKILVFINRILGIFFIDALFTCSSIAAKWMYGSLLIKIKRNKYYQINNKINAIEFNFSNIKREKLRKELKIQPDTIVIGNTGRMVETKRQLFLIDIFYSYLKINNDAALIILGDGILHDKIVKRITDLNLKEKVLLPGNRSDVAEWLQAMDVFVFPSICEGLGMSAIEAQAAGLLTFVSDNIPKEVGISDLCHFVNVDQTESYWADEIYKYQNYNRRNMVDVVTKNGYNSAGAGMEYIHIYKKVLS